MTEISLLLEELESILETFGTFNLIYNRYKEAILVMYEMRSFHVSKVRFMLNELEIPCHNTTITRLLELLVEDGILESKLVDCGAPKKAHVYWFPDDLGNKKSANQIERFRDMKVPRKQIIDPKEGANERNKELNEQYERKLARRNAEIDRRVWEMHYKALEEQDSNKNEK